MKILMEKGQCDLHHTIAKAIKGNKPMRLMKIKFIWESLLLIVDKIHSRGTVVRNGLMKHDLHDVS